MRNRHFKKIAARFGIILSVLLLSAAFTACENKDATGNVTAVMGETADLEAQLYTSKRGDIARRELYNGLLMPYVKKELYFTTGGVVLEFNHSYRSVRKGEVMARLDTSALEKQIEQQKLAVERAKLQYSDILEQGKLEIESAELALQLAEEKLKEAQTISEVLTAEEIEALEQSVREKKAALQLKYQAYGGSGEQRGYEIEKAMINVREAELQLEWLQKQLEGSEIICPCDGRIDWIDSSVKPGQKVSALQPLVRVLDENILQIQIPDYKGGERLKLEVGMKAEVTFNDKEGREQAYEATVVHVSPKLETYVADRQGYIIVEAPGLPYENIGPGGVRIWITLERASNAIIIPVQAVQKFGGKTFVYVLKDGMREERFVSTGVEADRMVEIVDGLMEGEQVFLK